MMSSFRRPAYRPLAGLLCAGLLVVGLGSVLRADPSDPTPADRQTTLAVTQLLKKEHLLRHPLDQEMLRRCLKTFLRGLDPMKLYFYQSDIDDFTKVQDGLAEAAAERGDTEFAHKVYKVYLARLDERMATIDQLLKTPQDFTVDEEMVIDKDKLTYPKTPAEAQDRWRKRIKYDLLVLKSDKADAKKDEAKNGAVKDKDEKTPEQRLHQRYHSLSKRMHQTNDQELLELYLNALTTSFDPHTDYMAPSTLDNFNIMMELKLEGIGATLQSMDGYTVVKAIVPGGAADKEGHLKLDDKIIGVDAHQSGTFTDVVDMKINDVVSMIRGKPGTVVRLQVIPRMVPRRRSSRSSAPRSS